MAIQNRRGNYEDFVPSKMLPGEFAVVQNGDPNATDGKAVYVAFQAGDVKRLATYNELQTEVSNAAEEIAQDITDDFEQQITPLANSASQSASNASASATRAQNIVNSAVADIQAAGTTQVTAVQAKGDEVLDSIPADYSDLSDDVTALKADFTEETRHSFQLIDVDSAVVGVVQSSGVISLEGAWANYATSDFIPVESGKTYTFYLIKADGTQPAASYRLIYCLFNSAKSALSYFNTDYLNKTVITPSQDGYIRVSCGNISSMQYAFSQMAMFVEGETILPYEEYYSETIIKLSDNIHLNTTQEEDAISAVVDEITDDIPTPDTISIAPVWTSGYCNKSEQITTPYSEYSFTQQFEVSVGDVIQLYDTQRNDYCNIRFVTAYASNVAVSASGQEGGYSYTVPSGIDSVRITISTIYSLENCTIYRHGIFLKSVIKPVHLPAISNVLAGKKWAVCGDSFTAYTNAVMESGKYVGNMRTYPFLIGNRNKMTILDAFAASGRTLAYPADGTFTNSLTCPTNDGYYQNIPADVDYITIMLGINDQAHSVGSSQDGESTTGEILLGTIDDATTATYYGAWNVVLGWLRENRPFAHVGIIVSNGIEVQSWVEAIESVAKKWGYPTLNLNGDDRCPAMIRSYNPNIPTSIKDMIKQKQAVDYDGTQTGSANTHPNWQAHEYESFFIENFLRSI